MDAPPRFSKILNARLSVQAWTDPRLLRLPGVQPLAIKDWMLRDDAFARQMAYRDWLMSHRRKVVLSQRPQADEAAAELLDVVSKDCGFPQSGDIINRPDDMMVDLSVDCALMACARLTQMDLCILQDAGEEHILTAGVMCFPSSWTLSEKLGRSLSSIHAPVDEYDGRISRSVQRMFKAIRPAQPLWRANVLIYTDPNLHQPRLEGIAKPIDPVAKRYVRVERQSFRRLPKTGAVIFGIHTSIVAAESLEPSDYDSLAAIKADLLPS